MAGLAGSFGVGCSILSVRSDCNCSSVVGQWAASWIKRGAYRKRPACVPGCWTRESAAIRLSVVSGDIQQKCLELQQRAWRRRRDVPATLISFVGLFNKQGSAPRRCLPKTFRTNNDATLYSSTGCKSAITSNYPTQEV